MDGMISWGRWTRWLVPVIYLGVLVAFVADVTVVSWPAAL